MEAAEGEDHSLKQPRTSRRKKARGEGREAEEEADMACCYGSASARCYQVAGSCSHRLPLSISPPSRLPSPAT